MKPKAFFGYGSLVNRATHDFPAPRPVAVDGWVRAWAHTDLRPVAFLTALPCPGARIEGLVAEVPGSWAALDERERAYDRVQVSHADVTQIYTIPEGKYGAPSRAHPVLLSYIDVVVQGYLREFGEDGVARFFQTTEGWEAPIMDDRAAPIYSRHQRLSPREREMVDDWLSTMRGSAAVME